jgi:NAD(P)-dependent dehydrogenase (short-subunit alcohol dehydrogenase family)
MTSSGTGVLRGRKVAITGGAQGIGRATAARLVRDGAQVVIGDVQETAAIAAASEVGARALPLDVTDTQSFAAFIEQSGDLLGGLDVLVNNAGVMPIGPLLEEPDRVTDRTVDVDLRGVLTGTKLAGRRFAEQGHGHVVNIASVMGTLASPNAATYCATKYAVVGLGEALRQEWRGTGVHVTTVCPGFVRTELIAGISAPAPLERFVVIDPERVAGEVSAVLRRPRSRTVFVPKPAGLASRVSANLPVALRDLAFRAGGGNQVTTGLDRAACATYQRKLET